LPKLKIIGVGRVGTAAHGYMRRLHGEAVVGVDLDPETVHRQQSAGRNVLLGDPGEADFWERVQATRALELVMLALPNLAANLRVVHAYPEYRYYRDFRSRKRSR